MFVSTACKGVNVDHIGKINHRLPQVEQLLQQPFLSPFIQKLSRPIVVNVIRDYFSGLRQSTHFKLAGCDGINIENDLREKLTALIRQKQTRVINATGTLIHTNLGRSPIDGQLWDAVKDVNTHYNNLELALNTGKRGQRKGLLTALLSQFTGADDGLVVNNNACSLYLILLGLAQGKEVIVSRGEQIQIGGGFRIPDILVLSGAKLVEVGTTNITTSDDYINAITENTAMVLIVHQSNFAIRGFTESAEVNDLRRRLPEQVILAVDQGSGVSTEDFCQEEKPLGRYVRQGADIVCFSGDKILGGPQAGIICGRADIIAKLEKNPMMRAFRPGKIILSLLEELLVRKLNEDETGQGISQKLIASLNATKTKAELLAARYPNLMTVTSMTAVVGGGTLPDVDYPCWGVTLTGNAQQYSRQLRALVVPVIGVIQQGQYCLNLASVTEDDFQLLIQQLSNLLTEAKPQQLTVDIVMSD